MQQDPHRSNPKPTHTRREGELTGHWIVLLLCAGILLGGLLLSPPNPGSPYLHIFGIPIPDTCSFKNLIGLSCPGCGLTRSIVAGMHGDLKASFMYHRLGLFTLIYVCLQLLYRMFVIVVPPFRERTRVAGKILNRGMIVLAALYVLNWGYTLLTKI